jgi:REP element-mobilizing transposase RayT
MSTYSKIYIQIVFAVKERNSLIKPEWEEHLFRYITGIIQNKEQKLLAINGMPDHVHLLLGMKPNCNLSELVREVKKSSNQFIRNEQYCNNFYWQEGFGAFSYGHSQLDRVIGYIMNQKEHHKKTSFKDEYLNLLKKFEIDYEDQYMFKWIE